MSKIGHIFEGLKDAAAETGSIEAMKEFSRVLGVPFDSIQTSLENGDKAGAKQVIQDFEGSEPGTNEHAAYEALGKYIEDYN